MKRRRRYQPPRPEVPAWVGALLALAAFAIVAVAGLSPTIELANADALRALQTAFPRGSADFVGLLLVLGSSQVTLPLLAVMALWLWRRGRRLTAASLALILVGVGIEVILKSTLHHPMVWDEFSRGPGLYPFPEIKPTGVVTFVSPFPSGHMLRATYFSLVFTGVVGAELTRGAAIALRVAGGIVIAGVAFGILYQGWHWPTDALGSLFLGYGLAELNRWAVKLEGRGDYSYRLSRHPTTWGTGG
jgi:membrane-associated phospholipid phosphatase